MEFRKLSLAAALALAIGALGAGCAQETAPTATAEATAAEHTGHAGTPAQAHDHGHDHHLTVAAGMDFPVPDHHDKWAPDAPLIEGMSRVRDAIAGLDGVDDETDVLAGAAEVDAAIEYMFENCSLPVEPDIALHAVLARLMAATRALNADPSDMSPVHDMHAAVENYEALFDDPGA